MKFRKSFNLFLILLVLFTAQACTTGARQLDELPEGLTTGENEAAPSDESGSGGENIQEEQAPLTADQNISFGPNLYSLTGSFGDPAAQLAVTAFSDGSSESAKFLLTDNSDAILRASHGKLFIINRGSASIQVVDLASHQQEADYSVGAGSNPQDIILTSLDKAYVSRLDAQRDLNNQDDVLVINPINGELITSIDLTEYTDPSGDRLARAAQMTLAGNKLYVLLQDLGADFSASFTGKLVIINTEDNKVIKSHPLASYNPYDLTYSSLHNKIYVSFSGKYLPDFSIEAGSSGIEVLDPLNLDSSGLQLSDVDFGGSVGELRIANGTQAYALVNVTKLAVFNPSSMQVSNANFFNSASFYVPDFTLDKNGDIWLAENTFANPGIVHLSQVNGSQLELVNLDANVLSLTFAGE